MRIKLVVAYDGTAYCGWQIQPNGITVEEVLNTALSELFNQPVVVHGASRTDAGVHAAGQSFHFDTECTIPAEKFPFVLNNILPPDIRIHSGFEVPSGFHARFMTAGKTYTYRILNSRHGTAIRRNNTVHVPVPLDPVPMKKAVLTLLGTHDFSAFQAAGGTAKTTIRTIYGATLDQSGEDFTFTISGNAFLYNMVRIIVGTLIEIGQYKRSPDAFVKAFASGNRLDLGVTAPPHGLELTEVRYPDSAFTSPDDIRWHEETLCSE